MFVFCEYSSRTHSHVFAVNYCSESTFFLVVLSNPDRCMGRCLCGTISLSSPLSLGLALIFIIFLQ